MASKWLRCDLRVSEARVLLCTNWGSEGESAVGKSVKIAFFNSGFIFQTT